MIFTYNKEHVGDVLMVIVADGQGVKLAAERKGNVARIYRLDNGETVAWNIFQVSNLLILPNVGKFF